MRRDRVRRRTLTALAFAGTLGLVLVQAPGNGFGSDAQSANAQPLRAGAAQAAAVQPAAVTTTLTPGATTSPVATATPSVIFAFPSPTAGRPSSTATPILNGLAVTPFSGPPGVQITITAPLGAFLIGSTDPSGNAATATYQDPSGNFPAVVIGSGQISGDGSLTMTATLPAQSTGGTATIKVTAGANTKTAFYVVHPVLSVQPAAAVPGSTFTISGDGFLANNPITLLVGGGAVPVTQVTSQNNGHFSTIVLVPTTQAFGPLTIAAADTTFSATAQLEVVSSLPSSTPTTTGTILPTATGSPQITSTTPVTGTIPFRTPVILTPTLGTLPTPGLTTAYFAEGYTGKAATNGAATFTEALDILNPNTSAATATIAYFIQGQITPLIISRSIPATTTLHESVNTDVGADKVVGAMVTSGQRLRVTRTLSRVSTTNTRLDGSTTEPISTPAKSWIFPEGYTGVTFQEYLTLLNPTRTQTRVTIRLAPQSTSGAGARILNLTLPGLSRTTADIRGLNKGNSANSVGMIITSDQPIVAERVMYFGSGSGSGKFGSSVTSGIAAPATHLLVGYGSSGGTSGGSGATAQLAGDQDYITLLNPALTGNAAQVTASFSSAGGHAVGTPVVVSVAPGTRQTIVANTALGATAVGPFSVTLQSTAPIAAEAPYYLSGSPNIGTHPGEVFPALTAPASDVLLSSLAPQLDDGTAITRTIFLYNPGSASIQITATYFGGTGKTAAATYTVPAGNILAVDVGKDAAAAAGGNALGVELKATGGSFIATAIGHTADNLSVIKEVGQGGS